MENSGKREKRALGKPREIHQIYLTIVVAASVEGKSLN